MCSSRVKNQGSHNLNKTKPNSNSVNNSVSNYLDSLMIFWAPPRDLGQFSSSALCSTHPWSSRLWVAALHCCCCSWQSAYGTAISKTPGFPCCNWATLSPIASSPGLSSGIPALAHSLKPQLLYMTPSCLQKPGRPGDSHPTKFSCQREEQPLHWLQPV